MNKHSSRLGGLYLLALPLVLAGSMWIQHRSWGAEAGAVAAGAPVGGVYDYADQVTRLVESQKIDALAKLSIPTADPATAKLAEWTSTYVDHMQAQETERAKQYDEAVSKAGDAAKREEYDDAMAWVLRGYVIAKDPAVYLTLDSVKNITAKVAAQAADYEKQGKWIESLQLYADLNSLYEIDTRYKPDDQRLARRTRLLAMYVPQKYYDLLKALRDKQAKERAAATQASAGATTQSATTQVAATKPAGADGVTADEDEAPPTFTKWKDYADQIAPDMGVEAIERAREEWVELTSYDTLVKGGVEALRLLLTTPELASEFPALGDEKARQAFASALDGALAKDSSGKEMSAADMERALKGLIEASNATVKLPKEVVVMEFTEGAMEKLDPFTAVIWPHELAEFNKNMQGTFGGVGIQISLTNGKLEVVSPLEDTPAYRAGISAGDIITAIDGKSAVGISIDQAVHSIMGKPGTQVNLRIKRGTDADKDYAITRDLIKVTSVKGFRRNAADHSKWDFMIDPDSKVGYVRITGFQEETGLELRDALTQLQKDGMRGVILDLRFNPGGLLKEAVEISNMFLTDGVIVSTKGRSANARENKWTANSDVMVPANMPVEVLVNQYSASASEILSGALKDLHRALIVGHRSFGKGSVQNLMGIGAERMLDGNPLAEMKLTMAYYYLPNGESLHRRDGSKTWGVEPDVSVNMTPEQILDLNIQRRDADIIHTEGEAATKVAATAPATTAATKKAPTEDTQLDTALLMMRLQLVQSHG